jgi:hypothetical protein
VKPSLTDVEERSYVSYNHPPGKMNIDGEDRMDQQATKGVEYDLSTDRG